MKRIVTILAAILLLPSLSFAGTPEEIAQSYFEMMKQGQWQSLAKLYDTTALKDFREMMSFLCDVPDETAPEVLGKFFGPGATKASVKALADQDFMAHFLRGVMAQAAAIGQLDFRKVEVLGSVAESNSLRHVVTRVSVGIGEMSVEAMEVISFRKSGDTWGILMQGKMKGMANQLKKAFSKNQR